MASSGVEEYRECVKQITAQRQREVYAAEEARDAAIKSVWIVILSLIAGSLFYAIFVLASNA